MEERKKKRRSRKRLLLLIAAAVILIALAAILIINGGIGGTLKALRGAPAENYYYEHPGTSAYAAVGRGFAVLNSTELTVWNEQGDKTYSALLSFKKPEIAAGGDYAAAWDLRGSDVYAITENGLNYKASAEGRIINVSINAKGYLALCAEETGYGGTVTVYNPNGRALYKVYSGSKYVYAAEMNGSTDVAVLSFGSGESELKLYKVTEEEPKASYTCPELILDVAANDSGYVAVTEEKVIFLDKNLYVRAEYSFQGRHLANYSIKKDITAVVTGEYRVGGSHEIVTLENDGSVIARLETDEDISWFEMGERAAAVLSPGKIEVFSYRLEPKESFAPPAGTEIVTFRDDDNLLAVGPYSTELIELGK